MFLNFGIYFFENSILESFCNLFYFCFWVNLISVYFQIIKMECQVKKNEDFRYLLLYAFNQGSKAAKAKACDWHAKFKSGNFDLKDAPCSGHPVWWRVIKLTFAWKFSSNDKVTSRENGMLLHCYRKASSLDRKRSEVWSMVSACFKWQQQKSPSHNLHGFACLSPFNLWTQAMISLPNRYWQRKMYINMKQCKEWLSPVNTVCETRSSSA